MTALRLARAIGLTVACLVLAASGAYVLVDLARWEWNRAILSALIFLSALVILTTASVLHSLRRLGERLATIEGGRPPGAAVNDVPGIIGTANAETVAARRFAWLERPPDRLAVFVPVLMGAGMVLSLVAYVIERVAGAVAGGSLDRRTATALHLDLPLGPGLVHLDPGRPAPARRPHHTLAWVLGTVLTIALGIGAVEGLRHLTQTRTDAVGGPGTTTIGLRIDQKSVDRPLPVVVADLWAGCRNRVPGDPKIVDVREVDDRQLIVTVDQAFGRVGRARIVGCLEDLNLDRVLADVLTFESVPARGG